MLKCSKFNQQQSFIHVYTDNTSLCHTEFGFCCAGIDELLCTVDIFFTLYRFGGPFKEHLETMHLPKYIFFNSLTFP